MGKLSFGATGLSYQVDRPDLNLGGAPTCPRCATRVYFNEERKLLGKSWHTKCFNCASCKKSLDSTNANGHEHEIYCTACHRRQFGIKGYGFAGGAAGLSTETSTQDIYRRTGPSTVAENGKSTPVRQNGVAPAPKLNGHAHGQTSREVRTNLSDLQTRPNSTVFKAPVIDHTDPECCPRCGRRVYFAEEVKAMKRKWHRVCFKCANCKKALDTGKCEGHKGDVYCTSCYAKTFGPKGYGYASSMIAADPSPHFHVRSAVSRRGTGSTSSTPKSPISPKSPASQNSPTADQAYEPYSQTREAYMASQSANGIGDTFNYNGQEWTEDIILKELSQFEQVM